MTQMTNNDSNSFIPAGLSCIQYNVDGVSSGLSYISNIRSKVTKSFLLNSYSVKNYTPPRCPGGGGGGGGGR